MAPAADENVIIKIAGGTGTATRVITEDEVHADSDYGTSGFFTNAQGLVFHNETLYWTDDNQGGFFFFGQFSRRRENALSQYGSRVTIVLSHGDRCAKVKNTVYTDFTIPYCLNNNWGGFWH